MINLIKTIKQFIPSDALVTSPYWLGICDSDGKFQVTDVQISGDTLIAKADWCVPFKIEYVNLDFIVNE